MGCDVAALYVAHHDSHGDGDRRIIQRIRVGAFSQSAKQPGKGSAQLYLGSGKTEANTNITSEGLKKQIESILQATQKQELQPGEVKKDAGKVTDQAQGGKPLSQVTDAGVTELKEKLSALDKDAAINVMVTKFGMSRRRRRRSCNLLSA